MFKYSDGDVGNLFQEYTEEPAPQDNVADSEVSHVTVTPVSPLAYTQQTRDVQTMAFECFG